MKTVAALFVDPQGAYSSVPGVDCWGEDRDARKYSGPHPVVAHPPCQLWGKFARVNYARWGGMRNHPGNDGGCFAFALAAVREFGGVLEHPAFSDAWAAYRLPRPPGPRPCSQWENAGRGDEWVCEVWQSAYGHKASKRTWLFYKGVPPLRLNWDRPVGTHQIGYRDYGRPTNTNKPTVGKREASATPPAFRDALLALARSSRPSGNHHNESSQTFVEITR